MLLASQNAIATVEMSVLSNLCFADEIIAVDNGSTDGTVEVLERLAGEHDKLTFINAPDIVHLYENRQLAFERSRYRWIVRGDSDFIAFTSGHRDIRNLRAMVLDTKPEEKPIAFAAIGKYVIGDFYHTKAGYETANLGHRVYQHVDGVKFARAGRWEAPVLPGHPDGRGWHRIRLGVPYLMHASIKSPMDRMLRQFRTPWRELGDFDKFPTPESYARSRRPDLFEDGEIERWAEKQNKSLVPYKGDYPEIVLKKWKVQSASIQAVRKP